MKTAMKKLFSLVLVAVLLVGVMPFQASAAEETYSWDLTLEAGNYNVDDLLAAQNYTGSSTNYWVHRTAPSAEDYVKGASFEAVEGGTYTLYVVETVADSAPADPCASGHSYTETVTTAATCTADGLKTYTCATCGDTYTETIGATGHAYNSGEITTAANCASVGIKTFTCANNATHTYTEEVAIDSNAHNFSGGKCTLCGKCEFCGNIGSHPENCRYYCNGTTNCPNDPTAEGAHNEGCLKTKCNKNGCTKDYGHTGECSVPCTKTAGCVLNQGHEGSCNTPCTFSGCTLGYEHTGDHSNACATCELPKIKSPEHNANCEYYYVNAEPEYEAGDSDLEIWVNLHTANVETKTRLLVTYEDLSEDTLIYEFISDRRDEIDDMLINYYGKDYEWSGHVYDSVKADTAVKTTAKLGEGTAVYINAYTYQDLVYVYVHDTRSYNNLRVILFEGKQIGDTISRAEIVDVVNDYYNLSSLRMYSEDDWKKVVQGKSVDARDNLKVTEEPFHIDVLISGTATAGSGYTADSSNPKTGDMIMTPAIIMCASISALATLFYLNKKRAI